MVVVLSDPLEYLQRVVSFDGGYHAFTSCNAAKGVAGKIWLAAYNFDLALRFDLQFDGYHRKGCNRGIHS